jgi:hypothetical protein
VPGRIAILMAFTEFPAVPGESVTIPLVLLNQGLEEDVASLSVQGIPSSWTSASTVSTPLAPGQQQEAELTLRPTLSEEGGARRHPFKILVASHVDPGQVAVADCALAMVSPSRFSSELRPQRLEAGTPARVVVQNKSNLEQAFLLTWQSPGDELRFEPGPIQQLRIPSGGMAAAGFHAEPRSRPLLGAEHVWPFTTCVQAGGGRTQYLNGEVLGQAVMSGKMLPAVLVALVVLACISVLAVLYMESREGAQLKVPAATAVPGQGQPPELPPSKQPASAEQLPAGSGEAGLLWIAFATGPVRAPLAYVGRWVAAVGIGESKLFLPWVGRSQHHCVHPPAEASFG